ncbi:protodermal factor [Arabis alpina]|uniref:Protodermal factor n=1 Tax=Arabis alpina TaxID=50452 RepID=A0A087H4S6_ARAAL|nr:protodermal factor [Arabis alpina]
MRGMMSFTIWALFVALLSQQLFASVASIRFDDEKTYYTPPSGTPPSHTPDPSTPSYTPPIDCGSPPYDPSTPPSHTPPTHTPTPKTPTPKTPTPKTPSPKTPTPKTPSPKTPSPKTPSHTPPCNCGTPPSHTPTPSHPTPSNPPSGGYYSPPTTPVVVTPPTPIDPGTPIIGGSPPIDPGTPGTPFVPAPFPPFTGTCDYWRNHPTLIWGLLGWWGTVGGAFGTVSTSSIIPGFDPHMNLLQALSNTRTDAIGSLYREGTASWLNSMVNTRFPFTTPQVRDHFVAGLSSTKAATKQAHTFKLANEGHLKPRI